MIVPPKVSVVRSVLVAGRKVLFLELATMPGGAAGFNQDFLSGIWVRESDVLVDSPQSAITRFLQRSHTWQNVPEFVWIDERAVKPVPLVEAEIFWMGQAKRGGDQWASMVVRELERLEELLYKVFSDTPIPESEQWTSSYRSFDGGAATLSNDSQSIAPTLYRPTIIERRAAAQQSSRVAVA